MTNEELRIKVGELCGLTRESLGPDFDKLPDYPNDMNACREFEATLRGKAVEWYDFHLTRIVAKEATDDDWSEEKGISARVKVWNATAEQRCRALIATMEGKP